MTLRGLLWRALRLIGAKRRYRKCLARIARLERELWPPQPSDVTEFSFAPGAVWPVQSANYVQVLRAAKHRRDIEHAAYWGTRF